MNDTHGVTGYLVPELKFPKIDSTSMHSTTHMQSAQGL